MLRSSGRGIAVRKQRRRSLPSNALRGSVTECSFPVTRRWAAGGRKIIGAIAGVRRKAPRVLVPTPPFAGLRGDGDPRSERTRGWPSSHSSRRCDDGRVLGVRSRRGARADARVLGSPDTGPQPRRPRARWRRPAPPRRLRSFGARSNAESRRMRDDRVRRAQGSSRRGRACVSCVVAEVVGWRRASRRDRAGNAKSGNRAAWPEA